MVSLGSEAYCTKLVASSIECTGQIQAESKVFGADSKNLGQAHFNGSVLYFKYNQVHQASQISTTSGQAKAFVTTNNTHGLLVGDTVHIGSFPPNPNAITAVNGIPVTEIVGTHQVAAIISTFEFTITTTTSATSTGADTLAIPLVRIDRYVSTDLALGSNVTITFTRGTTVPVALHTNTELFYS
jgi:hypothetical protein